MYNQKSIILSILSSFLTKTICSSDQLENRLKRITEEASELIKSGKLNITTNRNLASSTTGEFALEGFKKIRQYGCYCNFVNFRNVRGDTQDSYDENCKQLHDNYLCTIEESLEAGEDSCLPEKDQYRSEQIDSVVSMAVAYKTIGYMKLAEETILRAYKYCDHINDSVCMAGSCKSESRFIFEVQPGIGLWMPGYEKQYLNPMFIRTENGGSFDFDQECLKTNSPSTEPACCGPVPAVSRFNRLNGKECCKGISVLYNSYSECCGESDIKKIGDC